MDTYLSEKISILDGTLIALRTDETEVVIPAQVHGHRITRIGGGSCIAKNATLIRVEEGIREIGKWAFCGCTELKKIILPEGVELCEEEFVISPLLKRGMEVLIRRKASREQFEELAQHSFLVEGGERMAQRSDALLTVFQGVLDGFSAVHRQLDSYSSDSLMPLILDSRMKALYFVEYGGILEELSFDGQRERLNLDGPAAPSDEKEIMASQRRQLVKLLLKEMPEGLYDNASELFWDQGIRNHKKIFPSKLMFVRFREADVEERDGQVVIPFRLTVEKAFYASLIRIAYAKKQYYVFRRNFLMGKEELPIFREDYLEELYDETGEPVSEETRSMVLAKYLLMAKIL